MAALAATAASVTAMIGGESMMIESKCCDSSSMNSLNRCDPSNSAGFGGIRPAVSSQTPGTPLLRIAALATSVRPADSRGPAPASG